MSSVRVRSTPRAKAIVDSFLIEFKRSCEGSCYKIQLLVLTLAVQIERYVTCITVLINFIYKGEIT